MKTSIVIIVAALALGGLAVGANAETTDLALAKQIQALPVVPLPAELEGDLFKHEGTLRTLLEKEGLSTEATFQHIVRFNRPSPVTHEAKYFLFVISLSAKKAIRLEGDDLWLIAKAKKEFSSAQRTELLQLLGTK